MTAPLTPERLAEIRERNAQHSGSWLELLAERSELLAEVGRLQDEVDAQRKNHADLTSRMGFGDGVTEPQADNDTIMRAWDEMSSQSMEWLESQSWRTDCYLAGHPDDEDCHEHDPALRLLAAEAEVDRLRAGIQGLIDSTPRRDWRDDLRDLIEPSECRAALTSGDEVQP